MLDLVDALDPQQLMRLYCKVGRKIGPHIETIPGAPGMVDPNHDTGSYLPPALEAPSDPPGGGGEGGVEYIDLGDIEFEDPV